LLSLSFSLCLACSIALSLSRSLTQFLNPAPPPLTAFRSFGSSRRYIITARNAPMPMLRHQTLAQHPTKPIRRRTFPPLLLRLPRLPPPHSTFHRTSRPARDKRMWRCRAMECNVPCQHRVLIYACTCSMRVRLRLGAALGLLLSPQASRHHSDSENTFDERTHSMRLGLAFTSGFTVSLRSTSPSSVEVEGAVR
jgi:hypothetical protein